MSSPKVSILLPSYHPRTDHLREALEHLLVQTLTDWHLTILNQPWETDVRGEIANLIVDPRITFIQSSELRSIGSNWNACMQAAPAAPSMQFLFHDDLWGPRYLEKSLETLERNPTCGFCAAHHAYRYEGEVLNTEMYESIDALRLELLPGMHHGAELLKMWLQRGLHPNIIGEPPFVMMRRDVIEKAGPFAEDLPQFLDSEYWARLLAITDFFYIQESLGEFRVHPGATSAQNQKHGKGLTDRLRCIWRIAHFPQKDIAHSARLVLLTELPKMCIKYIQRLLAR